MDRRAFLRILLASAIAESVDVERLLWVPRPIVTVPALPSARYIPLPRHMDALLTKISIQFGIPSRYFADAVFPVVPAIDWRV